MSNKIDKIKSLIFDYTQNAGGFATMVQLRQNLVENGYDPRGTGALCFNDKIFFEIGHPSYINAIAELREEGIIDLVCVSPILYTLDGAAPDLPILSPRRLNILLRNWESTSWIEYPVWIPTALVLTRIDFFERPITTAMLTSAIDASDKGTIRKQIMANKVGDPSTIDGTGVGVMER